MKQFLLVLPVLLTLACNPGKSGSNPQKPQTEIPETLEFSISPQKSLSNETGGKLLNAFLNLKKSSLIPAGYSLMNDKNQGSTESKRSESLKKDYSILQKNCTISSTPSNKPAIDSVVKKGDEAVLFNKTTISGAGCPLNGNLDVDYKYIVTDVSEDQTSVKVDMSMSIASIIELKQPSTSAYTKQDVRIDLKGKSESKANYSATYVGGPIKWIINSETTFIGQLKMLHKNIGDKKQSQTTVNGTLQFSDEIHSVDVVVNSEEKTQVYIDGNLMPDEVVSKLLEDTSLQGK